MIGRMDEGMSSIILLSVPIFVLLGCVLDATGMGKAIVDFLASLLGHVRAGMSYVLLGSLFLVSGISGSKVSDMATVAPALFPEMKRRGHKPKEMIALLSTGAAMADTVPPSIVLIVLGSVAGVSIAGLFTSGFVVAMVLLAALAVLARWKAGERGSRRRAPRPVPRHPQYRAHRRARLSSCRSSSAARWAAASRRRPRCRPSRCSIPSSSASCSMVESRCANSTRMLVETAALSGAILMILGTALAMAWALTQTGFAQQLASS